jgi:hypothetical protein
MGKSIDRNNIPDSNADSRPSLLRPLSKKAYIGIGAIGLMAPIGANHIIALASERSGTNVTMPLYLSQLAIALTCYAASYFVTAASHYYKTQDMLDNDAD